MVYIPAKTIVSSGHGSGWFGADYNMNIYRGCNHGCIYCDSRSSCYQIENFAQVKAKERALEIIRGDLRRKVRSGVIGTGSMSDPYNPWERKLELTRHALELISAYSFGVAIATKGELITRDIDVLDEIREHCPVLVKMTITTPHDEISAKTEPGAPVSSKRFEAVRKLAKAGIYTGVLLMPVLPWINDDPKDIALLVEKAAEAGAKFVYPGFGLTMRDGQREYFYDQLDREFPGMKEKYGPTYSCPSPNARKLYEVFGEACGRLGLLYKMKEITGSYKMGYGSQQLSFFKE